jgi:hypothetical protein
MQDQATHEWRFYATLPILRHSSHPGSLSTPGVHCDSNFSHNYSIQGDRGLSLYSNSLAKIRRATRLSRLQISISTALYAS